jgi:15-cis-phytoene synthase
VTELDAAYAACEALTRARAANFYYGIRLLPPAKRRAMCAAYAFARRVDDIGDGTGTIDGKRSGLERARSDLERLGQPSGDPGLVALDDAHRRFGLPLDAMNDLIDGVEMDVVGAHYEYADDLIIYCRRVAGSIGRICVAIFGATDIERASALSDDLGVALQLTNILRDVREDFANGRVYLPAEDLRRCGCIGIDRGDPAAFAELLRFEAARAREWFDRGLVLLELLDRRSASCVRAMSGIYESILTRIERRPASVLDARISLSAWEKGWVAARSLAPR